MVLEDVEDGQQLPVVGHQRLPCKRTECVRACVRLCVCVYARARVNHDELLHDHEHEIIVLSYHNNSCSKFCTDHLAGDDELLHDLKHDILLFYYIYLSSYYHIFLYYNISVIAVGCTDHLAGDDELLHDP